LFYPISDTINLMSITPLKQGDKRWGSKLVGFGKETFAKVGCTVTALTCMINYLSGSNYTPDQVNDRLKEFNAFSDGRTLGKGNLLVWYRVCMAFPFLRYVGRYYNYTWLDNAKVAEYVYVRKVPVLVEVYVAQGNNRTKHWVLFVGNKKMIDPITGKVESTAKYPLTGYTLYQKI
jgi:hypothetical protein